MKIFIVLMLVANLVYAGSIFDDIWKHIHSQPPPKKVTKTHHKKKAKSAQKEVSKTLTVDTQWLANYIVLEKAWDYPIPDDYDIRFLGEGKYEVPIVVYRHYEDMLDAKKRMEDKES